MRSIIKTAITASASNQRPHRARSASPLLILAVVLPIVLLAAYQAWRIALAEHHARYGAGARVLDAVALNPGHPRALGRLARRTDDPVEAELLLRQAIVANPADPRNYSLLALLLAQREEVERAGVLAATAARIGPRRADIHYDLAALWLLLGDYRSALIAIDHTLELDPRYHQPLFGVLLELFHSPAARAAIEQGLDTIAGTWWTDFFAYAIRQEANPSTLDYLLELGRQRGLPLDDAALRRYFDRLMREQRWQEAYFVWLNQLEGERLRTLGTPYNGDFEAALSDWGFDWYQQATPGVAIAIVDAIDGGGRVLEIRFAGQDVRRWQLDQRLLLKPARYRFSGRYRLAGLVAPHGLQWSVHCESGQRQRLGFGPSLRGSQPWLDYVFEFEIPVDCPVQTLRLTLSDQTTYDFQVVGHAWFDALRIERTGRLTDRIAQQSQPLSQ